MEAEKLHNGKQFLLNTQGFKCFCMRDHLICTSLTIIIEISRVILAVGIAT